MTAIASRAYRGVSGRSENFDLFGADPGYVDAGDSTDRILGGDAADLLVGGLGRDRVSGGEGDDTIFGDRFWNDEVTNADPTKAAVADLLTGGSGADVIYGGGGNNYIAGQDGDDLVIGGSGSEYLEGGEGADRVEGGGGADRLFGGSSANNLALDFIDANIGSTFSLSFDGTTDQPGTFNAQFIGGFQVSLNDTGVDVLDGGDGDDIIDGMGGADVMLGGLGNDRYYVDNGQDIIREYVGEGTDYVFTSASYTLKGNVAVERMQTTNNNGTAAINLAGNEFGQQLFGNAAGNKLLGYAGNDTLTGYNGNDALSGGTGKDTLVGGVGNDSFILDAPTGSTNIDVFSDFTEASGNNDVIRLDDAIFAALSPGETGFFRSNATGLAEGLNDHIIFNATNGRLFYDSNGSQAGGAVQIAQITLVGGATLGEDDFIIF